MASQVYKRGPTTPEMNITPMIDVVFLLIIFFMLVNTIVTHHSVEMIVPDLDESQAREIAEDGIVTVNIAPRSFQREDRIDNPLRHDGTASHVQIRGNRFPMDDLSQVTERLSTLLADNPDLEVVLRADGALYYNEVQPVMDAITAARVSRVSMVAYDPLAD